jgi:DNA (cytosine-5)-methyltransferase 1
MIFGSVCSGMEAASLAWGPLGWRCAFTAEIEKAPSALIAQRFPNVPNHGDMMKFEEWPNYAIDLLAGGTPCQSFSVAGLRKGLSDPRGSLMLGFGAIAKRYRPTWLLWENVPGVLSSDGGRDFGAFLGMLAELGYGFAYRVLDAQFFGLAQRRKRVFVVGYLGDWRPPAAVLFERESLRGDPPPRREARERVAATITASTGGCSGKDAADGRFIPEIGYALNAHGGAHGGQDAESETLIAHALRADGFDASEDGTGRGTPIVAVEPYTLAIRGRGESHDLEYRQDGIANAVLTPNGGRGGIGVGAIAFDTTQITSPECRSNPKPNGPCHTLASGQHAPAIAFSCKDHGADAGEIAPTLRAMGHDGSHANAGGQLAIAHAFDARQSDVLQYGDIAGPVDTGSPPISVLTQWAVRRLTPLECERLQGAPDDWTNIAYRGKNTIADGPRYKMIGNSWAVPCVRWIGERIELVDALIKQERAA